MGDYCTSTDLQTFLRSSKNIIEIGASTDDDLSSTDLSFHIDLTDAEINGKLRKAYSVPLSLANTDTSELMRMISLNLTGYNVYTNLFPATADAPIPVNIDNWGKKGNSLLDQIINITKNTDNYIPLNGETTNLVSATPEIADRTPVFDGIGINQENNQFNDDVLENNSDGELE